MEASKVKLQISINVVSSHGYKGGKGIQLIAPLTAKSMVGPYVLVEGTISEGLRLTSRDNPGVVAEIKNNTYRWGITRSCIRLTIAPRFAGTKLPNLTHRLPLEVKLEDGTVIFPPSRLDKLPARAARNIHTRGPSLPREPTDVRSAVKTLKKGLTDINRLIKNLDAEAYIKDSKVHVRVTRVVEL